MCSEVARSVADMPHSASVEQRGAECADHRRGPIRGQAVALQHAEGPNAVHAAHDHSRVGDEVGGRQPCSDIFHAASDVLDCQKHGRRVRRESARRAQDVHEGVHGAEALYANALLGEDPALLRASAR